MPREYLHIKQYEKEILQLKEEGLTHREIGERLGIEQIKIKKFVERYHAKEKKQSEVKPKGRPRKNRQELSPSVQKLSKLSQQQYELSIKERYIKRLEMENELMRDFLWLTERK